MSERFKDYRLLAVEKGPIQDHCGLFAVYSPVDIPFFKTAYESFQKLQTRGYDGAGMIAFDSIGQIEEHRGKGKIDKIFMPQLKPEDMLESSEEFTKFQEEQDKKSKFPNISARLWLFQTRYGTSGSFDKNNIQPLLKRHVDGDFFVVAHNGQFSKENGHLPGPQSDTVLFASQLQEAPEEHWEDRILNLLRKKNGAYSLTIGVDNHDYALYLARDPRGIRPLYYGETNNDEGERIWIAASETRALDKAGVTHLLEVMPGTMIKMTTDGLEKFKIADASPKLCIFENVYIQEGKSHAHLPRENESEINDSPLTKHIRRESGRILAKEAPLTTNEVDYIVGVPGTGITGGRAYAEALGLPYEQVITDKDDERTFMMENIDEILEKVLKTFNLNEKKIRGKRIGMVDDSIVRGNITTGLTRLLKEWYGATEVHVRSLSPAIDKGCFLGINTRTEEELIAARAKEKIGEGGSLDEILEEIRLEINADSIGYLSTEGLTEAQTGNSHDDRFCRGCMIGQIHPIDEYGRGASTEKGLG